MSNKDIDKDLYTKISEVCSTIDGIQFGLSTATTCDSRSVIELFKLINDELKHIINKDDSEELDEVFCDKCNLACKPLKKDKNGKVIEYQCPICKQVYQN